VIMWDCADINFVIPCRMQSYLGGGMTSDDRLNTLFESRNRNGAGVDSLFLDSGAQRGRASVPASYDKPPPGFSSELFSGTEGLSSSIPRHFNASSSSRLGLLDRQSIGENLTRSQSAAPSLDGRLSMGLPPGLASRGTPLVSNRSGGDSYLESASDHSRILQLGQRRPASTGVIGHNQSSSSAVLNSLGLGSSSGAVRPAAKTLMDLIQEDDFPPESPSGGAAYGTNYPRGEIFLERPRTTSPLSQQTRDQYLYDEPGARDGPGGLTEALDRLQINQGDAYAVPVSD
jgi:hypothetical protein